MDKTALPITMDLVLFAFRIGLFCAVYRLSSSPTLVATVVRSQVLIAFGLVVLLTSKWLPATPPISAMAILTLGATDATIERFRNSPACMYVLVLHATIYGALYSIFIAATLHAAGKTPDALIGTATVCDLALSTLPFLIAVRHIAVAARSI